jgi:hypothetical protein
MPPRERNRNVNTMHSLKQIIAGALLACGVVAAGMAVGTGHTSDVYGSGGCPVGHYCGMLGH